MRERECRWKHSPRMLSFILGCLCLASLALAFLAVCDVQVKGSRVSPGCRLMSHSKIKSSRQECRESHPLGLISCNSRSRISPNALRECVQPALPVHPRCITSACDDFPKRPLNEQRLGNQYNVYTHIIRYHTFPACHCFSKHPPDRD